MPSRSTLDALIKGADWAIAHRDPESLVHLFLELSTRLRGKVQIELQELGALANESFDLAAARWGRIRAAVIAAVDEQAAPHHWTDLRTRGGLGRHT